MGSRTTPPTVAPGSVAVNEELIELLEADTIDNFVDHLRMSGGTCWDCRKPIRARDAVSLIVHLTQIGSRVGFLHFRCGPPQILDGRRSRRAALRLEDYLAEISSDVQGFVVVRSFPAPHAMLVVSPETPIAAVLETGDNKSFFLESVLEHGFLPIGPDVLDAAPELLPGWTVDLREGLLVCGADGSRNLISADLEISDAWRDAVRSEGSCLVVVAGIGVSTSEIGPGFAAALNDLAERGLVVAGIVAVGSSI
jgi:hypothetical protein